MTGKTWFEPERFNEAFFEAETKQLCRLVHDFKSSVISQENTLGYHHGTVWTRPAVSDDEPGGMELHEARTELPYQAVAELDYEAWAQVTIQLTEQFKSQFMSVLIRTVDDATEKSGNVIDAADRPFEETFLEMLESIEFGVDSSGKVTEPQIMVGPDQAQKIIDHLEAQPQSFRDRVDEIKRRKSHEALQRERERKSKFFQGIGR